MNNIQREFQITAVTKRNLPLFVDFPSKMYKDDPFYVPYMRNSTIADLKRLIFIEKSYFGLMAVDNRGHVLAKILLTVGKNKQLDTDHCGYFCMYDCVDDLSVSRAILSATEDSLQQMGAEYMCGPFTLYDPDNRRGVLVKGFDSSPMIFTSYNFPYYDNQLTDIGLIKQTDAYMYTVVLTDDKVRRLERLRAFAEKRSGLKIEPVNFDNIERDILDLHEVMESASTHMNYQDVLSIDEMKKIFIQWKKMLVPELILFARQRTDDRPVGFVLCLPDYFPLIREMDGRMNIRGIITYLRNKNRFTGIRGVLQYIIPEYQGSGLLALLYAGIFDEVQKREIRRIELGTILENNVQSFSGIENFGGSLEKIYRLYVKRL